MKSCFVEVDVLPAEPQNFAAPHAGHRRYLPRGFKSVADYEAKKRSELFGRPEANLILLGRLRPRRLRSLGNIGRQKTSIARIRKRLVKNRVDLSLIHI